MELFAQCVNGICMVEYISNKGGKKIMTNREWLRSLTDEELADFFIDDKRSLNGGICNICAHDCYCMYDEKLKCNNGIAIWLKQEYTGVCDYD